MGFHVSHSTWEINPAYPLLFHLQDYHLLWLIFPDYSITVRIVKMPICLHSNPVYSRYLPQETHVGYNLAGFRLFPFRSPLLRELHSLSLPQGTEMVHFPWSCFSRINPRDVSLLHETGCPIRKSSDQSLFATPRSISLLTTSFIAYSCQVIHH